MLYPVTRGEVTRSNQFYIKGWCHASRMLTSDFRILGANDAFQARVSLHD
jgi:hypothetical protein